jgi:hypothetical protein
MRRLRRAEQKRQQTDPRGTIYSFSKNPLSRLQGFCLKINSDAVAIQKVAEIVTRESLRIALVIFRRKLINKATSAPAAVIPTLADLDPDSACFLICGIIGLNLLGFVNFDSRVS